VQEWGYDESGRLAAHAHSVDTGKQLVERHVFEPDGFLKEVDVENVEVGANVQTLQFKLFPDAARRIKRVEYPSGDAREMFYDAFGQVEHFEVGDYTEAYTYDRNGEVLTRTVG
jgi:hypothetical protein